MNKTTVFLLIVFCLLNGVHSKVPEYITLCNKNINLTKCLEDNFKNVLKSAGVTGDESFNIPPIGKIHMDRLTTQATNDLVVTIINTDVMGFDAIELKKISIDNDQLSISFFMPRLQFYGAYEIKGQILIISMEGTGPLNVTMVDMPMEYKAKLKSEERKGRTYFYVDNNIEDTRLSIKGMGRAYYVFDNLFGGDPRLGPEINLFLNENWQEIFKETQAAIEMGLSVYAINPIINGYLRRIPIKSLFAN